MNHHSLETDEFEKIRKPARCLHLPLAAASGETTSCCKQHHVPLPAKTAEANVLGNRAEFSEFFQTRPNQANEVSFDSSRNTDITSILNFD